MTLRRGSKRNKTILSIRDYADGVSGVVKEVTQLKRQDGTPVLGNYNQELFVVTLEDPTGNEEDTTYWMDAGLRGAFKMNNVLPGQAIVIQHTGTKDIDQGTVQTYDIFELIEDAG